MSSSLPPLAAPSDRPPLPSWAKNLAWLLDDVIQAPGGKLGVGLDGVLGLLLPGAGDALTGAGSVALLLLALRQGVPTVILARMVLNIVVDLLVGVVPMVGDLFDLMWRSNRRNLRLLEEFRNPGAKPKPLDYVVVGIGVGVALLLLVLPLVMWTLYAAAAVTLFQTLRQWLGS